MAEIDHLVYAAPSLSAGVAAVTSLVGMAPAPGGPHPGIGTRNALLSLGPAVYLEVIAPDPDQPEPPQPRPFGIDRLATGALTAFAVHAGAGETIHDVVAVMRAHGADHGDITSMSRVKPDGEELRWSLTASAPAGLAPFVIEWGQTTHPAAVAPIGCSLVELVGTHPEPERMTALLRALGLDIAVTADPRVALHAVLDTPAGRVTLS